MQLDKMETSESNNKRIAKNSLILYADLIISSFLWLFASRYLLEALGVRDFGLYNVVGGIVVLLNIVNTAMISTSYRYIAYEMGKEDGNPNKVFNTCRVIHAGISLFIILIGWPIGDYYVRHYLNVSGASISDARFVFAVSIATCAISTYIVPYLGLITAKEKFGIKAGINILRSVIRFGLIILLLHIVGNRLKVYSVFAFFSEAIVVFLYITVCNHKFSSITKWKWVSDRCLYKDMFLFAFWIFIGALARIGKSQGAVLLVNIFFGTLLNAAYAIANTVNGFVSVATNSLSQAAVPQITKSFSANNSKRSLDLVIYISKYTYILMLLVCTPFLVQTSYILDIWLKEVPAFTTGFVQLILIDALITCLGAGIPALYQATGKIKSFQIALSVILLSSIVFGFIGYKVGLSPYSLLVIYCFLSLVDRVTAILLLKYKLGISIRRLIIFSYFNSFKLSLFLIPLYLINKLYYGPIISPMMIVLSEVVMVTLIFAIGLSRDEKKVVKKIVTRLRMRI